MPNELEDPQEISFDPEGEPSDTPTPERAAAKRGITFDDDALALDEDDDGDPTGEPPANNDEPPEPPPSTEDEGEPPAAEAGPTFEIDGVQYTRDELKEMRDKATDYTKKTMDLSEQRKQLEPVLQLQNYLVELPEQAREELFRVASEIDAKHRQGIPVGQPAAVPTPPAHQPAPVTLEGIDESQLSDEGVALFKALQRQQQASESARAQDQATIQALRAQLSEVGSVLPEVRGFIRDVQGDKEASAASAQIKAEWGVDVAPQQLRDLSKSTGIADMEAAWLKANKQAIVAGTFRQGHQEGAREKPKAPGRQAGGRVVNVAESKMTADQVFRHAAQGAKFAED